MSKPTRAILGTGRWALAVAGLLLVATCTTSQTGYSPIGERFEARVKTHPIDVFMGDDVPDRAFTEVAVVDVHLEATHFITYDLDDAMPRLKEQAREAGGDAIMAIHETKGRYLETSMFHVTAKAVRYSD